MTAMIPSTAVLPQVVGYAMPAQGTPQEIISGSGVVGTPDMSANAFTVTASGTPGAIPGVPAAAQGQQQLAVAPQAMGGGGQAVQVLHARAPSCGTPSSPGRAGVTWRTSDVRRTP